MNFKKLVIEFVTVFAVTLVTTALVTLLWSLIGHGQAAVDWETSFRLAMVFGIIMTWIMSRDSQDKNLPAGPARLIHSRGTGWGGPPRNV